MQTVKFKGNPDGKFYIDLQGESNYQKAIKQITLFNDIVDKNDEEFSDTSLIAHLILEDQNPYDPGNAVRVDIEDQTVGYLSREDAHNYRMALKSLELSDVIGKCRAAVFGKKISRKWNLGVWLSLDIQDLEIDQTPPSKPPRLFGWLFGKKY